MNVTDLNSTNGTYVGGKQLEPMSAIDLQLGDEMTFGKYFVTPLIATHTYVLPLASTTLRNKTPCVQ